MATVGVMQICWGVFLITCSAVVVTGNDLHVGDILIRNKRVPGACDLDRLKCFSDPFRYCASGDCLGMDETIGFDETFSLILKCVPICGPEVTNSSEINGTLSVDNGTNVSDTTQTSPFNTTTPLHWTDDKKYCSANFYCRNGGSCHPEYKNLKGSNIPGKCLCPDGYIGVFCHKECSLDCPANISCNVDGNGTQYCTCPFGSDIPGCEKFNNPSPAKSSDPEPQPVWMYPVIGVAVLVLMALLVYITLIKLRWRSLLVTKMFHSLQPYEDDDDKLFDAFISFRSSNKDYSQSEDDQFVYRVLRPALEDESSYKLCIHQRDFPPGEAIANNIIWAVENSRRTILVLSPLYLDSGWTRLEYQKALEEMSKLHHKIIPIIFEDISNITIEDPTLKRILSSVTYIKYPPASNVKDTKRFWAMLQMALPKIRSADIEKSPRSNITTTAWRKTSSGKAITSPSLDTQESWKSTGTDVTDVPMETVPNGKTSTKEVVIDINDADKIKGVADTKLNNKNEMNKNAEKYIAFLDPVN